MIFPGRTTPLVTGRCISSYPDTSEPNLLQKMFRFCLNIKMALMVLLIASFKTREIFEGGFCFIPLFLLGSGHVVTKTAAVNFIILKIYFHLNYSFLLVVFSLGIYHHNLSDYLKAYSIMFAFQQTHSTCDCQLHAVLVSLTIVIESPLCKFSKRLLDVGIKLFLSSLSLPLLHRQWVEALKSCWKSPGSMWRCLSRMGWARWSPGVPSKLSHSLILRFWSHDISYAVRISRLFRGWDMLGSTLLKGERLKNQVWEYSQAPVR